VQTCVVHLIRNTFKYSSKRYWAEIARDLKPVYTAVNADAALAAFEAFEEKWAGKYPAISKLWRSAWDNFVPFLDLDIEIRNLLSSTNAIWVFDSWRRSSLASCSGRWALALNAIDDRVLDSNCRARRHRARGRVPGLKRACTTQPRSAGDPDPLLGL
jgi:hypothetical protein